jgi:hypothetical protein
MHELCVASAAAFIAIVDTPPQDSCRLRAAQQALRIGDRFAAAPQQASMELQQ